MDPTREDIKKELDCEITVHDGAHMTCDQIDPGLEDTPSEMPPTETINP